MWCFWHLLMSDVSHTFLRKLANAGMTCGKGLFIKRYVIYPCFLNIGTKMPLVLFGLVSFELLYILFFVLLLYALERAYFKHSPFSSDSALFEQKDTFHHREAYIHHSRNVTCFLLLLFHLAFLFLMSLWGGSEEKGVAFARCYLWSCRCTMVPFPALLRHCSVSKCFARTFPT